MRILVLNGSARREKGVTGRLLKSLIKGLADGGAEAKEVQVQGLNITPCTACLSCMHKKAGECILDDDMNTIYQELKTSDVLIIATPVYVDGMSGALKTVIDRCVCCMEPFLTKDDSGRVRHPYAWRMPRQCMLISTAGFPEMETFDPLVTMFRAQATNFGSEIVAEICIPGSIALQVAPNRLSHHLQLIEEAGKIIASGRRIPAELLGKLNTPPMDVKEYLTLSAKYEAWCRKQLGLV
jgi:putative NADPH-quinone reductase